MLKSKRIFKFDYDFCHHNVYDHQCHYLTYINKMQRLPILWDSQIVVYDKIDSTQLSNTM